MRTCSHVSRVQAAPAALLNGISTAHIRAFVPLSSARRQPAAPASPVQQSTAAMTTAASRQVRCAASADGVTTGSSDAYMRLQGAKVRVVGASHAHCSAPRFKVVASREGAYGRSS